MGTAPGKKRREKLLRGSNLSREGKSWAGTTADESPSQWRREFDGIEAGATGALPSAGLVQQGIEAQPLHPEPQQLRAGDFEETTPSVGDGELKLTANPSTITRRAVTVL